MHCQRKAHSCFSCCGLWNLKNPQATDRTEFLKSVLEHRTKKLESLRHKSNYDHIRLVEYRKDQEMQESEYARNDPQIYVCPFLGYLDETGLKIGCLIHPQRTGRKDSQNASFYGATICLNYDCSAKESDVKARYSSWLAEQFTDTFLYSRILSDSVLYRLLEREGAIGFLTEDRSLAEAVIDLIQLRLMTQQSKFVTSFEVSMDSDLDSAWYAALGMSVNNDEAISRNLQKIEQVEKLRSAVRRCQKR